MITESPRNRLFAVLLPTLVAVVVLAGLLGYVYENSSSQISSQESAVISLSNQKVILQYQSQLDNQSISSLSSQIKALNAQIQGDDAMISTLNTNVSSEVAQVTSLNSQATQDQSQIQSFEAQAMSLQVQTSYLQSQISSLQSQLNSAESQLSGLQLASSAQSSTIVSQQSVISSLESGQRTTSTTYSSQNAMISIPSGSGSNQQLNFAPSSITVIVGVNNTILWTNNDNIVHNVDFTAVPAGSTVSVGTTSPNMKNGQTFTIMLTTPGTYTYVDDFHSWMRGTIVVLAVG